MTRFRDRTGRPGPATWALGEYPDGRADYPVTGVSWYEADAYASFAGKSLPTLYHWKLAAGHQFSQDIVPLSNFSGRDLAPVGAFKGMGSWRGLRYGWECEGMVLELLHERSAVPAWGRLARTVVHVP